MIEAAGGAVWRLTEASDLEVLLVHRPHRADWSLPKGKRRRSESAVDCALREVWEETGFRCGVGPELPSARTRDRKGRSKRTRYWAMHVLDGRFRVNDEVDEICWSRVDRVGELVSYEHELVVVQALELVHATVG
ncbi:MAG: NUDIX hydrolase [Ilumatobacteraceae bacterium]